MKIKMDNHVFLTLILLLVIFSGLYLFLDKRRVEEKYTDYIKEKFISTNNESSEQSVAAGASMEYGWGYKTISDALEKIKSSTSSSSSSPSPSPSHSSQPIVSSPAPTSSSVSTSAPSSNSCNTTTSTTTTSEVCFSAKKPEFCSKMSECPIEKHPDINKYVLKSSIPPPPDMSEYIKKTEIPSQQEMEKYMLRSECKPLPQQDMSKYMLKSECNAYHKDWNQNDYVLKSEVEACPTCPICPKPQKFYTPSPAKIIYTPSPAKIIYTPAPPSSTSYTTTERVKTSAPSPSPIHTKRNNDSSKINANDIHMTINKPPLNIVKTPDVVQGKRETMWNNDSRCDLGKFFY